MRTRSAVQIPVLFCLLALAPLRAQETRGDILGRVTDPSGAVIARATVRAVNTATNVQSTAATNETGDYVLPFLIPSTYRVTAEAPGFKT